MRLSVWSELRGMHYKTFCSCNFCLYYFIWKPEKLHLLGTLAAVLSLKVPVLTARLKPWTFEWRGKCSTTVPPPMPTNYGFSKLCHAVRLETNECCKVSFNTDSFEFKTFKTIAFNELEFWSKRLVAKAALAVGWFTFFDACLSKFKRSKNNQILL
jgi:hypothetical protein